MQNGGTEGAPRGDGPSLKICTARIIFSEIGAFIIRGEIFFYLKKRLGRRRLGRRRLGCASGRCEPGGCGPPWHHVSAIGAHSESTSSVRPGRGGGTAAVGRAGSVAGGWLCPRCCCALGRAGARHAVPARDGDGSRPPRGGRRGCRHRPTPAAARGCG
jgi:hypothetical protein